MDFPCCWGPRRGAARRCDVLFIDSAGVELRTIPPAQFASQRSGLWLAPRPSSMRLLISGVNRSCWRRVRAGEIRRCGRLRSLLPDSAFSAIVATGGSAGPGRHCGSAVALRGASGPGLQKSPSAGFGWAFAGD